LKEEILAKKNLANKSKYQQEKKWSKKLLKTDSTSEPSVSLYQRRSSTLPSSGGERRGEVATLIFLVPLFLDGA
jgi:hypothetical protein